MKLKCLKLFVVLVIVILGIAALASCGEDSKFVIKVYDGTELTKQYEFDENSTITIPAQDFEKQGYEFLGIFTDADLTQPFDASVLATEDLSLYVGYRAKTLYMMVDDGTGTETRINVTYGEAYELTAPTRDGYRFLNYSYMGEIFPMTGTYNYTNSIPIVAKWEKIVYLKVFDGTNVTSIEVGSDGKFELPNVSDTAEKTFGGYLNGTAAFGEFDAEKGKWVGTYTGKEDVYLTYKWNDIPKYTLTVNGLYGDDVIAPKQYKEGEAYALPSAPTRVGYFFLGYDVGGEAFTSTGTFEWEEDITVTAKWRRVAKITVYNGSTVVETITVPKDGAYTLTPGTDNADYTFGGFTKSGVAFDASGTYLGEEDLVVMQVWNAVPTYTLTVNGLYGNDVVVPQSYKTGATFSLPVAPTRDGYVFTGYTVNGQALTLTDGSATFTWSEDTTVTANWTARIYITVRDQYTGETLGVVEVVNGSYNLEDFVPSNNTITDADKTYTYLGFKLNNDDFAVSNDNYDGGSVTVVRSWSGVDRIFLNINSVGANYAFNSVEVTDGSYTALTEPTLSGYYFIGFYTDEECTEEFENDGIYSGTSNLTVYAKWRKVAKITVYNGSTVVETITVPKNGAYTLTPGTDTADYTFGGFTKGGVAFDASGTYLGEEDLIVMQVWNAVPTYTLTVNGLYGNDVVVPQSYKTGATFSLPVAPTRDGYVFTGYTVNGQPLTLTDGNATFTWSAHTTIVANWRKIIYVTIYDGQNIIGAPVEISENGTVILPAQTAQDQSKIFNGYTAAGITFNKNQDGTYTVNNLTTDVTVTIVWYTLPVFTLDTDGGVLPQGASSSVTIVPGENTLPIPQRDNYVFAGWYLGSDLLANNTGKYTLSIDSVPSGYEARLVAKWTSTDEMGEVAGKEYFKELDNETGEIVYVFLTGTDNYYLFGDKIISVANNNGVVTLNNEGNGFIANKAGTFDMTIESSDGSTRTVKCRVEIRVNHLASNKKDDTGYAENFKNGISSVIDAGIKNLIPDADCRGISGNAIINLTYSNIPTTLTVEVWDGEKYVLTENGYTYNGNAIEFADSMIGKQVRITIIPVYALSANRAEQTLVFEYKLNNGVNVYTSDDLFKAFGNTSVSEINVLREIKAQVDASQCLNGNINYPLNQAFNNGIYVRIPTQSDSITINGNCYMIDASSVALFDPSNGGLHQDGYCANEFYYYINVHSGIFTYHAESLSNDKSANITINDLYIHGNFNGDPDAETVVFNDNKPLLTGSQSYNGVVVRHGYLTMDNSRVDHTNVAVQLWGYDDIGPKLGSNDKYSPGDPSKLYTKATLSNIQIDVTFAQSVYGWGQVGIDVSSSYIGQSSGAAFHISDSPVVKDNEYAGYLRLSEDTVINNFVTGGDAWFVAFGKAPLAVELKMGLNMMLSGYGYTVTQGEEPDSVFNFMVMVDSAGSRFGDLDVTTENEESSNGANSHVPYYRVYSGSSETTIPVMTPSLLCDGMEFYYSDPSKGMSLMLEVFELPKPEEQE